MSVDPDAFRQALGRWASGVTVVACRNEGRVIATTVSAFTSLSLDPPLVLVALGPHATVRPFLLEAAEFGVSILAADQRRIATVFADPFPVGPSPFPPDGVPLIHDALVGLHCTVHHLAGAGAHALVTAGVVAIPILRDAPPLLRFRRAWHTLAD